MDQHILVKPAATLAMVSQEKKDPLEYTKLYRSIGRTGIPES
jgi:hypothetical protein